MAKSFFYLYCYQLFLSFFLSFFLPFLFFFFFSPFFCKICSVCGHRPDSLLSGVPRYQYVKEADKAHSAKLYTNSNTNNAIKITNYESMTQSWCQMRGLNSQPLSRLGPGSQSWERGSSGCGSLSYRQFKLITQTQFLSQMSLFTFKVSLPPTVSIFIFFYSSASLTGDLFFSSLRI